MILPGISRPATTRYVPSGLRATCSSNLVDVVARERRALAVGTTKRRFRIDLHPLRIERREVRLDLVVAERPEELRRHHRRRPWPPRVVRRVELEEPGFTFGVLGRDAGVDARCLSPDRSPSATDPAARRRGAADNLVDRERPRADAVGEPARIRDFVDGVDVLRAHAGRLVAAATQTGCTSARTSGPPIRRCRAARRPAARARERWGRRDRSAELVRTPEPKPLIAGDRHNGDESQNLRAHGS